MKFANRYLVLTALLLAGAGMAAEPVAVGPSGKSKTNSSKAPQKTSGSQLPGGTEHIPAGAGTLTPPNVANRSHHARRQDALVHAQSAIVSRDQLREQAANKAAGSPQ